MSKGFVLFSAVLLLGACTAPEESDAPPVDLTAVDIVDLSHTYDADTIYWPNSPSGFDLVQQSHGHTEGGWFYASNSFSTPEHGGTHMDAPIHFDEAGETVDNVPLDRLIGAAVVIDVSAQASANPDYRLSADDVLAFEATHGAIPPDSIVLLRTGWSQRWPDVKAYLGDDRPGKTDALHFPSFGEEAARLLIEDRKVAVIGVDTASIDYGASQNFIVHQIAGAHNVAGLENLTGLESLPATGATLIALPMKIGGGSGAPVRVVALIPKAK